MQAIPKCHRVQWIWLVSLVFILPWCSKMKQPEIDCIYQYSNLNVHSWMASSLRQQPITDCYYPVWTNDPNSTVADKWTGAGRHGVFATMSLVCCMTQCDHSVKADESRRDADFLFLSNCLLSSDSSVSVCIMNEDSFGKICRRSCLTRACTVHGMPNPPSAKPNTPLCSMVSPWGGLQLHSQQVVVLASPAAWWGDKETLRQAQRGQWTVQSLGRNSECPNGALLWFSTLWYWIYMYVRMYVCMSVCTSVCLFVHTYVHVTT